MKKTIEQKQIDVNLKIGYLEGMRAIQSLVSYYQHYNYKISEIMTVINNFIDDCDRKIDPITSLNIHNEFYLLKQKQKSEVNNEKRTGINSRG